MKPLAHRLKICAIKLTNWEYWNSTILYLPILPYLAFLWLKARSVFFFNAANPGIEYGGFLMESKWRIYKEAPCGFFPATVLIDPFLNFHSIEKSIPGSFRFPLVAKPDIGSKGRGVCIIQNMQQLKLYHQNCPVAYIVQEKIHYANEAGIFYVRMPGESTGKITGIVVKEYICVKGNGKASLKELLQCNPRYLLQLTSLEGLLGERAMQYIVPDGSIHTVLDIGNHARGSKFTNGSDKITALLTATIDALCKQIDGFYFGRLDIRFKDWESLEKGKDFAIIEINGSGSEPTHIYDPSSTIFYAWKEICRHWNMIYMISRYNHKNGMDYLNWKAAITMFKNNYQLNKKLAAFRTA